MSPVVYVVILVPPKPVVTVGSDNETELPKATAPPPDNPVPAVTVTDELARLALVMPAVPERLELVRLDMVLLAAEIVLLVRVSDPANVAKVPVVGNVTPVVPETVSVVA